LPKFDLFENLVFKENWFYRKIKTVKILWFDNPESHLSNFSMRNRLSRECELYFPEAEFEV